MDESYDIAFAWAKALASNTDLAAFCVQRFGKAQSVVLGFDPVEQRGEPDVPFLLVIPMTDRGGFEAEQAHSTVLVVLGLDDAETVQDASGAQIVRGFESLKLFETAARAVLGATDFPPSVWEAESSRPGESYFERHTFYQVIQDRTI